MLLLLKHFYTIDGINWELDSCLYLEQIRHTQMTVLVAVLFWVLLLARVRLISSVHCESNMIPIVCIVGK